MVYDEGREICFSLFLSPSHFQPSCQVLTTNNLCGNNDPCNDKVICLQINLDCRQSKLCAWKEIRLRMLGQKQISHQLRYNTNDCHYCTTLVHTMDLCHTSGDTAQRMSVKSHPTSDVYSLKAETDFPHPLYCLNLYN